MTERRNILQMGTMLVGLLSSPVLALAAEEAGITETSSLVLALVKVLGALAVVIGLMLLLIMFIKKTGISTGSTPNAAIVVLETKMIAPKKYIAVVDIAGKTVSLGITDHAMTLLTELDEESAEKLKAQSPSQTLAGNLSGPFARLLKKAASKQENTAGGQGRAK